MAESARWYVAHTYSGYENAVKTAIEKFVANRHLEDQILDIQIPMETVTEVTESGEMKQVERKVFPGYVLVKMIMTDSTWHLIRNIRGVTGFVGSANNAIPLTDEEVLALGMEKHEVVVRYKVGDQVKITDACSGARRRSSWSSIRWRSWTSKTPHISLTAMSRTGGKVGETRSAAPRSLPHL